MHGAPLPQRRVCQRRCVTLLVSLLVSLNAHGDAMIFSRTP